MANDAGNTLKKLSETKVGDVFGRLTVLDLSAGRDDQGRRLFACSCSCGQVGKFDAYNVRRGITKSCGCLRNALSKERQTRIRHGMHLTRVYRIWGGMKARCYRPTHHAYANYGGRGIKVCEKWQVFEGFFEDMGEPPPGASIDRIDNEKDYEPGNCRWADPKTQSNNRRSTRKFAFNGTILTLREISKITGLSFRLLVSRLSRGWSIEKATATRKLEKWERV